jgi:uncharacterized membrane protein YvbJ
MYCKNCGAQILNAAKYCPRCGALISEKEISAEQPVSNQTYYTTGTQNYNVPNYNNYTYQPPYMQYQKTNGLCIAGFIVSLAGMMIIPFISGIVGVILSIIGISKTNSSNEKGQGFGIAGIIIGVINVFVTIAILLILLELFSYYYYI